ncbi:hypothetical protein [Bradyrhizobium sp. BRP56]|uniref:hypothetical protein n=1 Tax=Bradyrhizobium sp. BRP56 TaxID=2793819 RepID=UPI001CD71BE1|nr:hypothetical protein [Bradyrhizobium sp. BRP56]MCA1396396.1 hypothetical protein [Bradyrhizobium sp. BRP56]
MIVRGLLFVILSIFPGGAIARSWFLNGLGSSGIYHIWEFGDDGLVSSLTPALSPPDGVLHLAWPSAIAPDAHTRRLYASAYTTDWFELRLWTSTNEGAWIPQGIAFQSDASEPGGIGPAQVVYEPGAAEPYMIYYLDRASKQIKLATSVDGMTFTRHGAVITPSLPEEASGLSISYACRRANGEYVIFYHGYYNNTQNAVALVATADSPHGPFTKKTIIARPDGFASTLSAHRLNATATADVAVPLGIPLLVGGGTARQEANVAIKQDETTIWFERPFVFDHVSDRLVSVSRNKVELSYAQEQPDGSWRGVFSLYNPDPNVASEYTTEGSARSLTAPWSYARTGFRFKPWYRGGENSTENPTPLLSNDACSS